MTPLGLEWVEKAEGDFATAERELAATARQNLDAVCFHVQQCVEKYLKARLQESLQPFPRTHDLVDLLVLALPLEPGWAGMRNDLDALTGYAVDPRYPGAKTDHRAAVEAMNLCRSLRSQFRASLGLPV